MSQTIEVKVPDIGDFKDVPVIEVLVKAGDQVQVEDPLITLESDKATLEVPSPVAGTVRELRVSVGDKVSEGALLLLLEQMCQTRRIKPSCPLPSLTNQTKNQRNGRRAKSPLTPLFQRGEMEQRSG